MARVEGSQQTRRTQALSTMANNYRGLWVCSRFFHSQATAQTLALADTLTAGLKQRTQLRQAPTPAPRELTEEM